MIIFDWKTPQRRLPKIVKTNRVDHLAAMQNDLPYLWF